MKKSVAILLFVAVVDRIILQGIYPVLPVLVANLGASKRATGLFMTVTYISIALGSMATPRLLGWFSSVNRLSIIISVLTAVALCAMGLQTSYIGLLVATSCFWCLSGIQINIYSVIMSYISRAERIGANYGLLANTTLVGAVLGSFLIGPLIHYWGGFYAFLLFGVVSIASRFAMMAADYDIVYAQHKYIGAFRIEKRMWVLLISFNTGMMLSFMGRFNLSLIMKEHHYGLDAISYIFAWGSLIVFPLPYLFGWLSQRVSNKLLLVITLSSVTLSMLLLSRGSSYPIFLTISFLICIMTYCSRGVSQKVIYDMYPLKQQTQAQSLLTSANWVAGIAGFGLVSIASELFSLQQVSMVGFVVGLASIVLLLFSKITT
jgi:MFS family permease